MIFLSKKVDPPFWLIFPARRAGKIFGGGRGGPRIFFFGARKIGLFSKIFFGKKRWLFLIIFFYKNFLPPQRIRDKFYNWFREGEKQCALFPGSFGGGPTPKKSGVTQKNRFIALDPTKKWEIDLVPWNLIIRHYIWCFPHLIFFQTQKPREATEFLYQL